MLEQIRSTYDADDEVSISKKPVIKVDSNTRKA